MASSTSCTITSTASRSSTTPQAAACSASSTTAPGKCARPIHRLARRSRPTARSSCTRGTRAELYDAGMDDARARELLSRERERIEKSLADIATPYEDRDEPRDASDDATELFDEELGEGVAERLRQELAAIERAEKRLEEGRYGLSIESGEPIPDGRLEAIPWAERTAEEQSRYERR